MTSKQEPTELTVEEKTERHLDFLASEEKSNFVAGSISFTVVGGLVAIFFPIIGIIMVVIGIITTIAGIAAKKEDYVKTGKWNKK